MRHIRVKKVTRMKRCNMCDCGLDGYSIILLKIIACSP